MKKKFFAATLLVFALALLLALPVAAEETKTIKAGTYRFNDVLTQIADGEATNIKIPFTCTFNNVTETFDVTTATIRYEGLYQEPNTGSPVGSLGYVSSFEPWSNEYMCSNGVSWKTNFISIELVEAYIAEGLVSEEQAAKVLAFLESGNLIYGEGIQTITITEDTEVSDEFYEWFNKNAVEQRQISGAWKFKDELTVPSVSADKGVKFSFILGGEAVIGVLGGEAVIGCSGMELIRQDAQGYPLDVYYICEISSVDLSAFGITLPHSYCVYDFNGWRIADYGEGIQTVDFGAEPQTVSADFYEWFTANAKPLLDNECTNYTDALYACECDVSLGSAWNGPEIYWAEDGVTIYHDTCGRCGITINYTVWDNHDYVDETLPASCESGGWTAHTCLNCGDFYTDSETSATGHSFKAVETIHATCTTAGSIKKECEYCGETELEVLEVLGHYLVPETVAPTCESPGYTKNACGRCDYYEIVEGSETPATGHSMEATKTVHATCTTDGRVEQKCSNCGETGLDVIKALGHDYRIPEVVAPTCEAGGYTKNVCSRCTEYEIVEGSETPATGHNMEAVKTVHATCTTDGRVEQKCSNCGETGLDVIKALGHYLVPETVAPTCESPGYTKNACGRCDYYEIVEGSETDKLAHTWQETTRDEPTCTVPGIQRFECAVCGESNADTIPALGHAFELNTTYPATCTAAGYTLYKCSRANCTEVWIDPDSYTTAGHSMKIVNTTPPTCAADGLVEFACEHCGHPDSEKLAALEHSFEFDAVYSATCTAAGYTLYKCSRANCEEVWIDPDSYTTAGHSMKIVNTTPPTCTADGLVEFACEHCGHPETETLVALGHSFEFDTVYSATCTAAGYTLYKCSRANCEEVWIDPDSYTTTGHTPIVVTHMPATCTESGLIERKCSECDAPLEDEILPAKGHQYVEGICIVCGAGDPLSPSEHTWQIVSTVPATCTAEGSVHLRCTVCSEEKTETLPASGHSYSGNVCIVCGMITEKPPAETDPADPKPSNPGKPSGSASFGDDSDSTELVPLMLRGVGIFAGGIIIILALSPDTRKARRRRRRR